MGIERDGDDGRKEGEEPKEQISLCYSRVDQLSKSRKLELGRRNRNRKL